MSFLFEVRGHQVWPHAEALLISPFREIWERDASKDKKRALEDLAFVEFCTSVQASNPFASFPEGAREEVVRKEVVRSRGWKRDALIDRALEKAREMHEQSSTVYRYYMSAKRAVERMTDFLNTVDLDERNAKTGALLHKPSEIIRTVNDIEKTMANLKSLEERVRKEAFGTGRNRGDKRVSPFAEAF